MDDSKTESKKVALEAAQLALALQAEITRDQIKQISKDAAEQAITSFHRRYGLKASHWVYLDEQYAAHKNTGTWIRRALVVGLLTICLSFSADAIVHELQSIFGSKTHQ